MKNKGFVLMETIIVIVVISVALLTIFASYNKILTKVKTENKYDTSEYIYMTYHIKKDLKAQNSYFANDICPSRSDSLNSEFCGSPTIDNIPIDKYKIFGVTKIYILTNLNNFDVKMYDEINSKKNSSLFDAYMIDYIRKLDVRNNDELIIVEYKKPVRNPIDYTEENTEVDDEPLYETYIASLEW